MPRYRNDYKHPIRPVDPDIAPRLPKIRVGEVVEATGEFADNLEALPNVTKLEYAPRAEGKKKAKRKRRAKGKKGAKKATKPEKRQVETPPGGGAIDTSDVPTIKE